MSILEAIPLQAGDAIVDIGCGRGELLAMFAEKYAANGIGVDKSADLLSKIRSVCRGSIAAVQADMDSWIAENSQQRYQLIIGIGSLREERLLEMIQQLASMLHPGSYLLVGELVWVAAPSAPFLSHLGCSEASYQYLPAFKQHIERCGLQVLRDQLTPLCAYESALASNVEAWALSHPEDPDREAIVSSSREWHAFSQQHAWPTWEFATIIARKEGRAPDTVS